MCTDWNILHLHSPWPDTKCCIAAKVHEDIRLRPLEMQQHRSTGLAALQFDWVEHHQVTGAIPDHVCVCVCVGCLAG